MWTQAKAAELVTPKAHAPGTACLSLGLKKTLCLFKLYFRCFGKRRTATQWESKVNVKLAGLSLVLTETYQNRTLGQAGRKSICPSCWGMWRMCVKELANCFLSGKAQWIAVEHLKSSVEVSSTESYRWHTLVKTFFPLPVFVLRKCSKKSVNSTEFLSFGA